MQTLPDPVNPSVNIMGFPPPPAEGARKMAGSGFYLRGGPHD